MGEEKIQKIQVMIENYNTTAKKYDFGNQEIADLSVDKIVEILQELPFAEDFNPLSARILINRFYFIRKENDKYYCYKKSIDLPEKEKSVEIDIPTFKGDIPDFKFLFWEESIWRVILTYLNKILIWDLMLVLIPIGLLFAEYTYLNFFFMAFFIWLLLIASYNFIYVYVRRKKYIIEFFSEDLISEEKKKQIFKIKYYTPIISDIRALNLSRIITISLVLYGSLATQLLALIIFNYAPVYYWPFTFIEIPISINVSFILLIIYIGILTVWLFITFVKYIKFYIRAKKKRKSTIEHLNQYLQSKDLDWGEKHFCLQLILEIEKKPIVSLGLFTKLLTVLTFTLSIIPTIVAYF